MGRRTIEISDDAYRVLESLAHQQATTPEAVAEELISLASGDDGPYYETEDWFRHLGATEEQIRESARLAALPEDEARPSGHDDADA
jgi:hypothetical protein